jgi:hypothetical protein
MENLSKYRLPIAVGVVVILGIALYVVIKSRGPEEAPTEDGETPAIAEIDTDDIDALEIHRPDEEPIRLAKRAGHWRVISPIEASADESAVTTALDKLGDLELAGIAATKAQNHERLEVDDAHGVRVIAKQGERTVIDFRLGAYRSGNTMLRLQGQERVLSVRGSIKYAFNKPLRDWRNRSIVDSDPEQVSGLVLRNPSGTYTFTKAGEDWQAAEGTTIDRFAPSKVRSLVSSLARLRAVNFADEGKTAAQAGIGPDSPTVTLTSTADGGPGQVVMRLGSAHGDGDREFYLMREGDETVYVVSSFIAEKLRADTDDFQTPPDGGVAATPEPPPEMPPGMGGGMPGMPPGMPGMPPGGGGKIPPEIMRQIQEQLRQQGAGGGGGDPHGGH